MRTKTLWQALLFSSILMSFTWGGVATLPAAGRTFDSGYYGASWGASRSEVLKVLRGDLNEQLGAVPTWRLPYVRELGNLYFMNQQEFSFIRAELPLREGGRLLSDYYFFRNGLSMVRVSFDHEHASFQDLLASLSAEYGEPRKDVSHGPDEIHVLHRYELSRLIMEVTYNPRRIEGGYGCDNLEMLIIHRDYVDQVQAHHRALRERYQR